MKTQKFRFAAWGIVVLNLAVVAWGAFVRASFSGDGCGAHWPTCHGEIIPVDAATKTWVEFSHRGSSGFALLCIVALAVWAFYVFPRGHWARRGAVYSVIFIFSEALVGAALVLFQLVTDNESIYRALALSLHLLNTFVLLAFLLATAWAAGSRFTEKSPVIRWQGQGKVGRILAVGLVLMLIAGVCGSLAALGDMLFPSATLAAGLQADLNPLSHFTVRLRWLHPVVAIGTGIYLVWGSLLLSRLLPVEPVRHAKDAVIILVGTQIGLGILNWILMAPIPMQLLHLLLADLLWLSLIWLTMECIHANATRNAVELKADHSQHSKAEPVNAS